MSKVDQKEVEQLYNQCQNVAKVAKELHVTSAAIRKRLNKVGIKTNSRLVWDRSNDEELKKVYLNGYGYLQCAKHFGVEGWVITRACRRLKINDSSRAFLKKHDSSVERSCKRRPFEFTVLTKKLRFEQEKGICQWCHNPIEGRFMATYHHIKMIDEGGKGEPENCMVLHKKCHIDNFEVLHNGRRYKFDLCKKQAVYKPHKEKQESIKCCICNRVTSRKERKCIPCEKKEVRQKIYELMQTGLSYRKIALELNMQAKLVEYYGLQIKKQYDLYPFLV